MKQTPQADPDIAYRSDSSPAQPDKPVLYIRKQFFKLPGMYVRIFDNNMRLLVKAHALPLRLKEKINLYSDEKMKYHILTSATEHIVNWSVVFAITQVASKKPLGYIKRKGVSSQFVRDNWQIFDVNNNNIGDLLEDSNRKGLIRRFAFGLPQVYFIKTTSGEELTIKQSWNPLLLKYRVYSKNYEEFTKVITQPFLLGILSTIAVIEGRQR